MIRYVRNLGDLGLQCGPMGTNLGYRGVKFGPNHSSYRAVHILQVLLLSDRRKNDV